MRSYRGTARNIARFRAKSDADIFVASRVWDQRSENVSQRHVEAPFQFLVERILAGEGRRWHHEQRYLSAFYALWHSRFEHAWNPEGDLQANGIGAETRTKDEEEILERNGYLFMSNGKMPARQVNGMRLQLRADIIEAQLQDLKWGVWTSPEPAGDFLVPDYCSLRPIIPITPRKILIAGMDDAVVGREEVAQVNLLSVMGAHQYVFARDYSACPIVPERSRPPFPIRALGAAS